MAQGFSKRPDPGGTSVTKPRSPLERKADESKAIAEALKSQAEAQKAQADIIKAESEAQKAATESLESQRVLGISTDPAQGPQPSPLLGPLQGPQMPEPQGSAAFEQMMGPVEPFVRMIQMLEGKGRLAAGGSSPDVFQQTLMQELGKSLTRVEESKPSFLEGLANLATLGLAGRFGLVDTPQSEALARKEMTDLLQLGVMSGRGRAAAGKSIVPQLFKEMGLAAFQKQLSGEIGKGIPIMAQGANVLFRNIRLKADVDNDEGKVINQMLQYGIRNLGRTPTNEEIVTEARRLMTMTGEQADPEGVAKQVSAKLLDAMTKSEADVQVHPLIKQKEFSTGYGAALHTIRRIQIALETEAEVRGEIRRRKQREIVEAAAEAKATEDRFRKQFHKTIGSLDTSVPKPLQEQASKLMFETMRRGAVFTRSGDKIRVSIQAGAPSSRSGGPRARLARRVAGSTVYTVDMKNPEPKDRWVVELFQKGVRNYADLVDYLRKQGN